MAQPSKLWESTWDLSRNDVNAKCIWKLMDAVDSYIPTPPRATDKPFLMPIEGVFGIKGRGMVATDRVEHRIVKVGDTVEIIGTKEETHSMMVTGVEMFQKILDRGEAGENVGCLHWPNSGSNKLLRTQLIVSFGELKP